MLTEFKKRKKSVFFKLTFVVIISGILIAGSVMLAFRLSTDHKPRKYFGEFIRKFEQKIVSDIGIPPDTIKAREIADELEIGIRFESQNFIWSNDKDLPSMELLEKEAVRILPPLRSEDSSPPGRIMRYKNVTYSIIDFPEGHFIIDPINPDRFFKPEKAVILSVVFVLLIVSGMYFYLRYLFTPLKSLTLAVQSIGEGNYDVKVPEGSSDELGELGHAINDMSGRISEAMKAKEQLLIDVSHELRSPITRIKLGLELGVSSEKLKEDLCEMEKMVSGMLDNYRSDNKDLRMAKTELVALIKDIINEYSNQERLEVIDKAAKYFINCDSERIRTVLRNIIDNSLKYSEKDVIIDVFSQGRKVIVSVTDQGIGISEDDLKYIFEPFYRADPSRSKKTGGFGLGLSICKKIMSAHKGEIKITSNLGSGTEVRLIFRQTEENYQ